MKLTKGKLIYEKQGVYGDQNKLEGNSNRMSALIDLFRGLDTYPKRILDLGCGTGFLTNKLKDQFPKAEVIGTDISTEALSVAKKLYKNIKFVQADVELKFPFNSNSFNLIVSGEQIEHLSDTDIYLSEINRVLKTKGILILTTPNLASWLNRILMVFGKQPFHLEPSLKKTLPIFTIGNYTFPEDLSKPPSGHLRLFTLNMLKKLMNSYGFRTDKVIGRTFLGKPIIRTIDFLFSLIPSLSFGLILVTRKIKVYEEK